ncbi:hypothetical protein PFISCL1PPCAC_17967, partial [Pristionchus fissidentatus]
VQLAVHFFYCNLTLREKANENHVESFRKWLCDISKQLFCRGIDTDELHVSCHDSLVEESILQDVTALFDFRTFVIKLHNRAQPGLMNFVNLSGKPIDRL